MPTIGMDPATGRLTLDGQVLDRNDPRLYGRAGRDISTFRYAGAPSMYADRFDPRYYERVLAGQDDTGDRYEYRLRPEYAERIGDRIQLGSSGVGGEGEINDWNNAQWDDEWGIVTDPQNINAPQDSGLSGFMNSGGLMALLGAAGLSAIGQAGGFSGFFGGAPAGGGVEVPGLMEGMAPYSPPSMLPASNVMGAPAGLAGAAGAGGGASGGVGPMAEMGGATGGAAGSAGSGSGGYLSRITDMIGSNPGQALRLVGGLAAMGAGTQGGSGNANAVGSMGDLLEAQANANRYNWNTPYGSRSWDRGEDGRWTVTDSMNPEEQANYENVRSMNADSTGYARELLARTMAAPRRDYFGSLPTTDSYFSRWRG